jgi:hypothetical protein
MADPVLTYAEFSSDGRFAPFSEVDEATVQVTLDLAHQIYDAEACGALHKQLIAYQTAVLLSTGWSGAPASKYRPPGDTPYDTILNQMRRTCLARMVVCQ